MRGGLVTGAAAALVCLAAAAWLAEALLPPAEEAAPESAEALSVRGIAVREEQSVYAPEGGSLILAPEGGRVAAGGILAAVSPTREGLLAAAREAAREEPAAGRSLARAAAYAAASGRAELAEPFAALWSEEDISGAYELIRNPVSAIWSRSTDALEYLGPEALEGLDGDGLAELMALSAGESPAAGRLVTGRRWYFAAALPAGAAALEGGEALLRIAGREYPARLVSLNGGAAVFELAEGLEETLYLRFADAEIVFQGDR